MSTKPYLVEVTMPSGEKLPQLKIDPDAFTLTRADEVGRAIGYEIGKLIDRRLKGMTPPSTDERELVERLQKREHYFLNASEGEYDANLLRKARFALESLLSERTRMEEALKQVLVITPQGYTRAIRAALSRSG
jgi:hypothetical protein